MSVTNGQIASNKVKPVYDASGNVTGLSAGGNQIRQLSASNTIMQVGDSMALRANRFFTPSASSVDGNVLTLTASLTNSVPPPGSLVLCSKSTDARLIGRWPVLTASASGLTCQLDGDYTGATQGNNAFSLDTQRGDTGFIWYAQGKAIEAGKEFSVTNVFGGGGYKVADLVANIAKMTSDPADRIAVMIGINDCIAATPTALDVIISGLESLYTQILAAGKLVDAFTITPLNAAYSTYAVANALLKQVNAYIRSKATNTEGMTLIDAWAVTRAAGQDYADTGMLQTDHIHHTPLAALTIGNAYYTAIAASLARKDQVRVNSAADAYVDASSWNLLLNPLFAGTAGTVGTFTTGPVPDSWTVNSATTTTTVTQPAHASGLGADIQLAQTTTGAQNNQVLQDITSRVEIGSSYEIGAELEIVDAAVGHYARVELEIVAGGVTYVHAAQTFTVTYAVGARFAPNGTRLMLVSGPLIIPPSTTSVLFKLRSVAGASGQITTKWGRPFCRKVSAAMA